MYIRSISHLEKFKLMKENLLPQRFQYHCKRGKKQNEQFLPHILIVELDNDRIVEYSLILQFSNSIIISSLQSCLPVLPIRQIVWR